MARTPPDPARRLEALAAARAAAVPGEVVSGDAMAKILGLTWRRLRGIVDSDPSLPVQARGGEGVPWEFDAAAVLDHLIERAKVTQGEREARMATVSRLAGLGDGPGGGQADPGSVARDMLEQARAFDAMLTVQTKLRAERERQNELLERAKVQAFLWRWLSKLQAEVLAIQNRLERRADLPAEVRAGIPDELASILVSMRSALEAEIQVQNAPRR